MAKPILHIMLPRGVGDIDDIRLRFSARFKEWTENEYHIIIGFDDNINKPEIACYNDCKGLTDVDIENLISKING